MFKFPTDIIFDVFQQFIMRSNKAKKDTENKENDDGPPPFVSYKIPTTVSDVYERYIIGGAVG
jgi:hypothetical protein